MGGGNGAGLGAFDLATLQESGGCQALAIKVTDTYKEWTLANTYDMRESTDASRGWPLGDLRNFSRLGAKPAVAVGMMSPC